MPGGLLVADGRVAGLGVEVAEAAEVTGAGTSWFAVPGLRNAHVHLDLSQVRGVPRPRHGFTEWVRELIRARGPFDARTFQRGAEAGAREALATGTTSVGDIDSSGAAASAIAPTGLRGIVFREVLGRAGGDPAAEDWARWVGAFSRFAPGSRVRPGISPHAPYSTAPELYRAAAAFARGAGIALATHVAETQEERQFLANGSGPFRELLAALRAPPPFATPPGRSPIGWIDGLGVLGAATLAIHANYPDPGDLDRLRNASATVAFCPRSHAFFGHRGHPVRDYLDRGIPVALGTDSRASNDSLSMLDEMAWLRRDRDDLTAREIFHMATAGGARFLEGASGRLDVGEAADFFVAEATGRLPSDLNEALDAVTSGALRVVATYVSGELCFVDTARERGLLPLTRSGGGLLSSDSGSSGGPGG